MTKQYIEEEIQTVNKQVWKVEIKFECLYTHYQM